MKMLRVQLLPDGRVRLKRSGTFKVRYTASMIELKECRVCHEHKPAECFSFHRKALGTRQTRCKPCATTYGKAHYAKNPEPQKARNKVRSREMHRRGVVFMAQYLALNPCVDCGEADVDVLEFDHIELRRRAGGKPVTSLTGQSESRILAEIAKCEVRCANCHTRRTRRQMGRTSRKDLLTAL